MDTLKKRLGYLKGLSEGLGLDEATKEGKIFQSSIDLLERMAEVMEGIVHNQLELAEYLEMMDEDLGELEEVVFGEEEFYDEYEEEYRVGSAQEEAPETEMELACPHCLEVLDLDPTILDDEEIMEIICPKCGQSISLNEQKKEADDAEPFYEKTH